MARYFFAFFMLFSAGIVFPLRAQDAPTLQLPAETKFVIQLNVDAFRSSALGKQIYGSIQKKIVDELKKEGGSGEGFDLKKVHEALGFDPYQEIRSITVSASDYDSPENSLVGVVQMGSTSGNLEGMMLAIPGYASEEWGQHTIHSATIKMNEEDSKGKSTQVFGAIHTSGDKKKSLIVGANKGVVQSLLSQMDGKQDESGKPIKFVGDKNAIVNLAVLDIPRDKIGEGPQANIARIVSRVNFLAKEEQDKINFALSLNAKSEKQANQIQQMLQGLVAMAGFIESLDPDDEDLKMVQEFAKDLQATRDGTTVSLGVKVSSEDIAKLIQNSLNDD